MVGLGMEQAYAQAGTDDAGVIVGERAALVGVELGGQPPPAQGLFERLVEGGRVRPEGISGIGNQARMVVPDDTQKGRQRLGISRRMQKGAGRKIGHPEVVDERGFEALGRSAQGLAQLLTTGLGVQLMLAQEPIDRIERGQLRILLEPAPVKHFDGHGQVSLGLFENPFLRLGAALAGLAFIGSGLGHQSGKAALLVVIPPVLKGATGEEALTAIGQSHRTRAHLFQGHRKRKTLAHEVLDFGDEGKTLQCERLQFWAKNLSMSSVEPTARRNSIQSCSAV